MDESYTAEIECCRVASREGPADAGGGAEGAGAVVGGGGWGSREELLLPLDGEPVVLGRGGGGGGGGRGRRGTLLDTGGWC